MEDPQPSLSRKRLDLDHAGNNTTTTTIPFDLIIEILSLLPAKSLLRFQSVSKLWFSTIRSKRFVHTFQTRSKTRPRLLLLYGRLESREYFIFSAPEYNKNDDDKPSTVMARYDMRVSVPVYYLTSGSINGFVCFRHGVYNTITVYNPTTRQIVKLPDVTPKERNMNARLGYDPVEDQYKVLCVMLLTPESQDIQQEHLVCTLSSSHDEKQEWRKIENPTGDDYQSAFLGQVCIDGALYYGAGESRIVRFDVRTEKIEFIETPQESHFSTAYHSGLINYKGKLGGADYFYTENSVTLWVLEDAEKQEWSSMKCDLPSTWKDVLGLHVASEGMNHTGDLIVFNPWLPPSKPFYACYYDFNKGSIRKVQILGMEDDDLRRINCLMSCYPGHIDNIRFL